MKLLGAQASPAVSGIDPLPGKVNYFRGKDPAQWRTGIPSYAKVKYQGVYPGIDLVYYGQQRQLEHDFIVSPAADPGAIRLGFEGTRRPPRLDDEGSLILATAQGEVRLHKPLVYQDIDGRRQEVAGRYVLHPTKESPLPMGEGQGEGTQIGFEVAAYDHGRPLVIDPILVYSTYLGGRDSDAGLDIAVDGAGNAYVTGETGSTDFPIQNALQPIPGGIVDAFITKIRDSVLVNALVSFAPVRSTFRTLSDTAGCPAGSVGKFLFDARLADTGGQTLSDLFVQVQSLSRGNRLLSSEGLLGPAGSFPVPRQGGFADGRLGPAESVDVPFTVCLKRRGPFRLVVNVQQAS